MAGTWALTGGNAPVSAVLTCVSSMPALCIVPRLEPNFPR